MGVRRTSGDTRAARGHESGAGRGRRGQRARDAKRRLGGRRVTMQSGKASAGRGAARDGVGLGCLGGRRGQSRLRVRPASASSRRKFTSDASAASTYVMAAARSTFFAASDSSYVT